MATTSIPVLLLGNRIAMHSLIAGRAIGTLQFVLQQCKIPILQISSNIGIHLEVLTVQMLEVQPIQPCKFIIFQNNIDI